MRLVITKFNWSDHKLTLILASIAFFCFGPIVVLIFQSFSLDAHDYETFQYVFQNMVPGLLGSTFSLVGLTCLFSVFLGALAAILTQLTNLPYKRVFDFLFIVPLSFPLYVLSFIYVGSLEYSAPFLTYFREAFHLNLHPYIPIKSVWGVAAVFSLGLYPYTYLFIRSGIQSSAAQMITISRSLGKDSFTILFYVLIPHLKPWLLAASAITAMETLADFGGVSAFNYNTFTTAIYSAWSGLFSLPTAARLSTILVFIALFFFFIESRFSKKADYSLKKTSGESVQLWSPSFIGRTALFILAFGLLFFSLFFPIAQLLYWAVNAFEIEWSSQYFELITNTIKIGLIAAVATTLMALIIASIKRLSPNRLNRFLTSVSLLGYSLPGNIIAVAAFIFLGYFSSHIVASLWVLIIALGIRFIAVAYRSHDSAFKSYGKNLEPAARSLGASHLKIFSKIHLPLMSKSIFLSMTLVFLEVIKEMPITVMLRPFDHNTLSVKIYELTIEGEWERASIAGLLLVCSGMIFSLIYARYGSQKNE